MLSDRSKAYVALGPSNRVAVVDGQTYEVLDYLLVGQRVWQLAFSPDEKFIYSTNGVSNDISVIDVEADKVTKSDRCWPLPLGRGCPGLMFSRTYDTKKEKPCVSFSSPLTLAAATALAVGQAHAQAGLLSGGAEELEPIKLSSGQPLTEAPYELESGKYYEIEIEADGSAEIALTGP